MIFGYSFPEMLLIGVVGGILLGLILAGVILLMRRKNPERTKRVALKWMNRTMAISRPMSIVGMIMFLAFALLCFFVVDLPAYGILFTVFFLLYAAFYYWNPAKSWKELSRKEHESSESS